MASRNDDSLRHLGEAAPGETNRNTEANPTRELSRYPRTLEAAQSFLRRAARQLKPGDPSARRVRTLSAEIRKQGLLLDYHKGLVHGYPKEDLEGMKERIKFMNMKELSKLEWRLPLTPSRLAVRYLRWTFSSLGTTAPNPIDNWLHDLQAVIEERYQKYSPFEIYRAAEREIFCLASVYCKAIIAWIEDFCAILPFDAFAANSSAGEHANPDLLRRLIERHHRLLVWEAVIKILDQEYLHATVLPAEWRDSLNRDQLRFPIPALGVRRGGRAAEKLLEPAECMEQARAKLKILLSTALAKTNITECHELIFRFPEVRIKLLSRLDDLKELRGFAQKK